MSALPGVMETRIVCHDGRRRGPRAVRNAVRGIAVLLEDDGWDVEYHPHGSPWIPETRAALVLTDRRANYRMVFDLGDARNLTKHWVRLEMLRAAVAVGALLDFSQDEGVDLVGVAS